MVQEIIFIVVYTNAKNRSNFMAPRLTAVQMLSIFIMFNIYAIVSILNYLFFNHNILPLQLKIVGSNFDIILNYIILLVILMFIYTKKRIQKIEKKYENTDVFSKKNILTLIIGYAYPLVIYMIFIQLRLRGIYFW
jgi:SNF family Na+-dependent transporter